METGPFLNIAAFCDGAVIGHDGVLTIVRIIDTVIHKTEGPDVPDEMQPFIFQTKLVVALKAGQAKGRFRVIVRPQAPDGRSLPELEQVIHLDGGGHTGVNIITDVNLGVEHEGLYWFDIVFAAASDAERLLTRIPLLVQYFPQRTQEA